MVGVVTGADVVGTVVVGTAVEPPDGPDESVHPAARRTAMARSAREKSMPVLIVHRLYHDPIIFLFSFPRVPPLSFVFIRGGREIQKRLPLVKPSRGAGINRCPCHQSPGTTALPEHSMQPPHALQRMRGVLRGTGEGAVLPGAESIVMGPDKKDTGPGLNHADTAGTRSGPVSVLGSCRRAGLPSSWCRRTA